MYDKNVILMITSTPYATLNNYEALRTSISLIDHKLSVVWWEEGVYNAIKAVNNTLTRPFIRLFEDLEIKLYVDKQGLSERGLEDEELIPDVRKLERTDILELICGADVVLTF